MKEIDVAIAVVTRGSRILICQRKLEDTFGGFWEFPGGKCEPGEQLEQCLARELMEELSIEAKVVRKLTTIRHEYPNTLLMLHPYLCEISSGEPKPIESQRVKWVKLRELSRFRFPPANKALLNELRRTTGLQKPTT
jgi:mutator protein MutT